MSVQLHAPLSFQHSNKLTTQTKFSKAAANYTSHANVQKQAAAHLFKMMASKHQQGTCLDLGAGPLVNTALLKTHFDTVLAMDLSHSMLSTEQNPHCLKVCADMDNLPLQQNSLDCVFSNFAMQWSADLEVLLKSLFYSLKTVFYKYFLTIRINLAHRLQYPLCKRNAKAKQRRIMSTTALQMKTNDQATQSDFDNLVKFVRVRSQANARFVEFDFAIGDPKLFIELVLPQRAFEAFCTTNQVVHMTEEEGQIVDAEFDKWRYGEETLMAKNHDRING